jgi:uncharacterized protein
MNSKTMKFNCNKCGACCRQIGSVVQMAKQMHASFGEDDKGVIRELAAFPYSYDESGACEKLDKNTNTCTIYEARPNVCRVDYMRETYHKDAGEQEYNKKLNASCEELRERIK